MSSSGSQIMSSSGRETLPLPLHTFDSSDTLAKSSGYVHTTQSVPATEENQVVPQPVHFRRQKIDELNWKDVASLIINKMVGTGIFTGPFIVLFATNNRYIAVALWILGFLFSVSSMFVYLELARDLPYSGGEMTYLDELFSSRKQWWVINGRTFTMLAYTLYATYSICIYTTANNSLEFAWQVYRIAYPQDLKKRVYQGTIADQRVLRLIAVAITTVICGLLYFSTSTSRKFNRWTAYVKLALLGVIIIAGGIYQHQPPSEYIASDPVQSRADGWAIAILNMLFSFDGWENATLVAGEIPHYSVLRRGFIAGVLSVGFAYITIISIFCFTFTDISKLPKDYLATYFGDSVQAHQAASVLTALSAVGSMISVTYTCVAVNRVVAWSNIIPGSPIWRKSSPVSTTWWKAQIETSRGKKPSSSADPFMFDIPRGTPEGAVFLHWIVTVFWICVSSACQDFQAGTTFASNVVVYGHCFTTAFVGLGFIWFKHDTTKRPPPKGWNAGAPWRFGPMPRLPYWVLGTVTGLFSVAVIFSALVQSSSRVYMYVVGGVIITSTIYWYAFVKPANANRLLGRLGLEVTQGEHGRDDRYSYERACETCRGDSSESGIAHRHAEDGFRIFNQVWAKDGSNAGERILEIFGGPEALLAKPVAGTALEMRERASTARRSADKRIGDV